jgi:crotonobetainyl-CoA:carnitine CoA-transferase CaiB-like acyl-CoA transferase
VLEQATTAVWLERFAGRIPAAPVHDLAAALENPFVRSGDRVWKVPHPARADFRMLAPPFTCPGEALPRKPAPALGQDTEEVLQSCGLSPARIAALRRDGVV